MTPGGIIFDCDGVLFESKLANLAYYNAVFRAFDVPPVTMDQTERAHICHTAASPQVFEQLLGLERRDAALAMAATLDYREFIPYMTPEPGMAEVVAILASRWPLAVATNRGNSMREILHHFGLDRYFNVVVTSRDVHRPKPHPDMLLLAAQQLGCDIAALLFVGDSELDAAAARAAGMPFVAYRSQQPGAPTVHSHNELLQLVQGDVRASGDLKA